MKLLKLWYIRNYKMLNFGIALAYISVVKERVVMGIKKSFFIYGGKIKENMLCYAKKTKLEESKQMRKRKYFKLVAVLAGLLLIGVAGVVMADSGTSTLTVTVAAVDMLTVSNALGAITLNGSAGSSALTGSDTTALLNFTHNNASPFKITAEATTNPADHDITLTVEVASGAGAKTICTAGTADGVKDVFLTIAAGTLQDKVITYGASATTATPADNYAFVITFTSVGP